MSLIHRRGVLNSGAALGTYSEEILARSPLGYWPMDDTSGTTCDDDSGNAADGTYTGTPTFNDGSIRPDAGGTSVRFDGLTEMVTVPWQFMDELTVVFHVTVFTWDDVGNQCLLAQDNVTARGFQVYAGSGAGRTQASLWTTGDGERSVLGPPKTGGSYQFVAVTYKQDGPLILYENGVETDRNENCTGTMVDAGADLSFMARGDGALYTDGRLSGVAIWNEALTPTAIRRLAQASGYSGY